MRRIFSNLALCITLASMSLGCGNAALTQDIKTQAEVDPRVDFSGMKTYAWAGGALLINDPEKLWTPGEIDAGAEIKYLIDEEMRARGWSESLKPDMLVGLLVLNDVKELKAIESERAGDVPDLTGVGEGAILIELVDATTGKSIWLGAATGESRANRPAEESRERFSYAIKEIFKNLPK